MSQIKKGALLNYTNIFLTNIIGLLLTPFIIKSLGVSEYGLYILIGSLIGYISVLDFGLNNAIVRFTSKYRAKNDRKGEENFLATSFLIYIGISTVVFCIGMILYYNIEDIFSKSLTPTEMDRGKIMFLILIFNITISLPGGAFKGICFGYEIFVFPKSVDIIRYIVRSLLILSILLLGGKAIAMVVLDTILNLTIIAINAYYVFKKLHVRVRLHNFNLNLVKHIFSYSIWIFLGALISLFQWRTGQMILGIVTNTTVVAIFAVGVILGTYYGGFSGAISGVFLPRATQMSVKRSSGEELTSMMVKIGRISFIVLLYILGAFLLYGKQFVYLWVGETYHDSYIIASIIMIVYTPPLVQAFGNSILEAQNKLSFKNLLYLGCIGGGTAVGALLAKNYGGIGMIIGSSSGWFIGQNILNVYYHKVIKLNIIRFYKELLSKTFGTFLIIVGLGLIIKLIPGVGWLNFIIKSLIYSLIYFSIMFKFGTLEYEKELILKPIRPAFKKLKSFL